jgi:hypothetical protein
MIKIVIYVALFSDLWKEIVGHVGEYYQRFRCRELFADCAKN